MTNTPQEAVSKIAQGEIPVVLFSDTYEMHKILREKGVLEIINYQCSVSAKTQFSYKVIIESFAGVETYLSTWKPGQVVPELKFIGGE